MPDQAVMVSTKDQVQTITINRPHRRNAVDLAVRAQIYDAIESLETDPELRVGIITGSGSQAFCAGKDLKEANAGVDSRLGGADGGFAGFVRYPRTKPVIAAVNGLALGGGFEIVLACELALATPSSWFALPEPSRGIVAGGGGAIRLPHQLPRAVANEVLLVGRRLTAEEAKRWGIVNEIVPPDELLEAAHEMARAVCASAPLATAGTMAIAEASRRTIEAAAWDVNDAVTRFVRTTRDAKEGSAAFAEKRTPSWSGQ